MKVCIDRALFTGFVSREPEELKGVCACIYADRHLCVCAVLKHVVCMRLSLFTTLSAGSDNAVLQGD